MHARYGRRDVLAWTGLLLSTGHSTTARFDRGQSARPAPGSPRFVVLFEVKPSVAGRPEYLDTAARLRPLLDRIDGFISVERFASRTRPGWLLSLSYWQDEASLVAWRAQPEHHEAQVRGRTGIFDAYRLRVGQIISRVDLGDPHAATSQPPCRTAYNHEGRPHAYVGLIELTSGRRTTDARERLSRVLSAATHGAAEMETFESLSTPDRLVALSSWVDESAARAWSRRARVRLTGNTKTQDEITSGLMSIAEIERDYGLHDRDRAPQYMPPPRQGDQR